MRSIRTQHFADNANTTYFPIDQKIDLDPSLAEVIIPSIQQFQLGESSEWKSFKQFAQQFSDARGDQSYIDSVNLFIAEENRHSDMLKVFLTNCGYPLRERDPVDSKFRFVRKLLGIESTVRVLLVAEINAMTYYAALHKATEIPQLQEICKQILSDEWHHLRYQSFSLQQIKTKHWKLTNKIVGRAMRLFIRGVTCIVQHRHRDVFKLAGYSYQRLRDNNLYRIHKCEVYDF